jgi:putative ABC transport system ATP-binding protein
VSTPKLVLADEPTANLDSVTGASILELMKELNQQEGTTFVFSTHDQAVMALASRVVRVLDGRIVSGATSSSSTSSPTAAAAH